MTQITTLVIHFNRQGNVRKWIEGIRRQTVPSEIWVWDNSGNYPEGSGEDVLIRSTKNINCQARVLMAGAVTTPYIYNQDDDLAMTRNTLLQEFIDFSMRHPDAVIGWNGRKFQKELNWEKAYSFPNTGSGGGWVDFNPEETIELDMINYGVSFLPTHLINQVHINPYRNKDQEVSVEEYRYGDDMYVSNCFKKKMVMPFNLKPCYEWLEEGPGLSKQHNHMTVRDRLSKRYWEGKYQ